MKPSYIITFSFILFPIVYWLLSAETQVFNEERKIILSGSFNPLHDGHLKLLEVATRYINKFLLSFTFDLFSTSVIF